jgi:hypothetical protein
MSLVMAGRRPATGGTDSTAATASGRALWAAEDLIRLVLSLGVGAVVVTVAWYICSGDASFNRQIGPLDAAVGGLVVAGLGNVMWLLRGRRALGERRRSLLTDVAKVADTPARPLVVTGSPATPSVADPTTLFVAGEGLVRFHRSGCPLVAGRDWVAATRLEHEGLGRLPCGVCAP